MARYVVLLDWTDQGVRTAVKETVQRVAQARTAWEPRGVRIESLFWCLGDHDIVAVIQAPDDATLAALLAHPHTVQTRPQPPGAPRTEAPLHPRRLAWQLAVSCQSIAQAFELQGAEATHRWNKSAAWLTHSGKDPNGRRRPSVLDQLRGWKRQPVRRKQPNNRDVSHGHIKVAA